MTWFSYLHPLTKAIYFGTLFLCIMLIFDPAAMLIVLSGLLLTMRYATTGPVQQYNRFLGYLAAAVILINFLFNHRGTHVLTWLLDRPLTLEALIYGITSALMIICIILLFQTASGTINTSQFLYLFRRIGPQLGLLISMTCGFFDQCSTRGRQIQQVARIKDIDMKRGTVKERLLAGMQIMHALIALTLENGLITVQTMKTRGYNLGRRTSSLSHKFRSRDGNFTLLTLVLSGSLVYIWVSGVYRISVYPSLKLAGPGWEGALFYGLYGVLLLLPLYRSGSGRQKMRRQREGL